MIQNPNGWSAGEWAFHPASNQLCQVIEARNLWGDQTVRVWLPTTDRALQVSASALQPVAVGDRLSADAIIYKATAVRIAEAMANEAMLAPLAASVVPLPHQLQALSRVLAGERVRYLLADEVGLGKTIEAGLVLRELKLRGLVQRVLIVTPKGLSEQWIAEMRTHFGEEVVLVNPSDLSTLRMLAREHNPWSLVDQVVCSMDAVKPIDARRGWSRQQIDTYNRDRFESLLVAGWDLVIVDEAHRLGGSTDQIARFRLGQGLAAATPYLLLLSATPHQGKSDAFRRILTLLDEDAFPDDASLSRARVHPYVIRTEKRQAIDADGKPLFRPRLTRLVPVFWVPDTSTHRMQADLYEAVSAYVRDGYNQALAEKRNYVGFLLLLLQRMVSSSTAAIRVALERRLASLEKEAIEERGAQSPDPRTFLEEWEELDSQEQAQLFTSTAHALSLRERAEVATLLALARRCEGAGPDAKAAALLDLIYDAQRVDRNPAVKVLVFTEFISTQEMLADFLETRGFTVAVINGGMDLDDRQRAQQRFAGPAQILLSTDAGGEGLNLQFCHVVVNYDIPWNPMRLEQRIGRVDRIGQSHPVYAHNLVLADTVEYRVREVLEEKLALIRKEFGIDKTGDVLDSGEASALFEELYLASVIQPDNTNEQVEHVMYQVREQAQMAYATRDLLGSTGTLDTTSAQRVHNHPLPAWTERMTIHYVRAHGGIAQQTGRGWLLQWPESTGLQDSTFQAAADQDYEAHAHLTIESPRVRALVDVLDVWPVGGTIPVARLSGLPDGIAGTWSLWRVTVSAPDWKRQGFFPLFVHLNGRILAPTARRFWDLLLTNQPTLHGEIAGKEAEEVAQTSFQVAETQGEALHLELRQAYQHYLTQLEEKKTYAFAVRQRALERLGLYEVRQHRLTVLQQEREAWQADLQRRRRSVSTLDPLLFLHISKESS